MTIKNICIGALVCFIFITGVLVSKVNNPSVGSVVDAGTYHWTSVNSTDASSTNPKLVRTGYGTLGSIVIASTSAMIVRVYDGTATTTGTLLATFPSNSVVGTYTFDVAVKTGIVLDVPASFNGSWVVTTR
jgi:hypothetical protein